MNEINKAMIYNLLKVFAGIIIGIFILSFFITGDYNDFKEELRDQDTNIYCQASIECENNCNLVKDKTFLGCRYECLTLKNCD